MLIFLGRFSHIAHHIVVILLVLISFGEGEATAQTSHFSAAAPLPGATAAHSATVLANGDVLVVGGYGKLFGRIPVAVSMARIYDHKQGIWRVCRGRLNYGRLRHAAIRMPDGKVMIVGGVGQDKKAMSSVELYDPAVDEFRLIGNMAKPRSKPQLNLLPGGRVLITGKRKTAEIIEPMPTSDTGYVIRTAKGKCHFRHTEHAAVTLSDGSVLLVGGRSRQLERFDPNSEIFHPLNARLPTVLDDQAAALLYNGKVLLAGGQQVYSNMSISQSWIYDPEADVLTDVPELSATSLGVVQGGAADMVAVDLFGNDPARRGRYILLAGGEFDPGHGGDPDIILDSAWVYDAVQNRLISVGPMLDPHDELAAAPLPPVGGQARALIIAGFNVGDSFQANCEVFTWQLQEKKP